MLHVIKKGAIILFSGLFFGIAGLIVGAYIGGNFAVEFTFNGVRGYEATGQVGFLAGIVIGIALSSLLLRKHSKKNAS